MKAAFLAGVLLGLAAVLAAARFFPWVDLPRLPSRTEVLANGGRAEQFLIRLPADRIGAGGSADAGRRASAFPAAAALPDALREAPVLVEQFKVRDRTGSVIGVAARHWTRADAPAAAWLLVIPGRGALMLASAGEPSGAVDRALEAAGLRDGRELDGRVTFEPGDDGRGEIAAGTGEFQGLDGEYTESWTLTGAGEDGQLNGTVELNTVVYVSS